MSNHSVPVYLDCNYEILQNAKNKLNDLGELAITYDDIWKLNDCITGELDSRYNGGAISNSNIVLMGDMIERISKGITNSVEKMMSYDRSSREMLREYVERALNYANPIDRSKYPHLSDDMIEKIYDCILIGDNFSRFYYQFDNGDIEVSKEALKLILSNNISTVLFSNIKSLIQNMSDEEREEIYYALKDTNISIANEGSFSVRYDIDSEQLRNFVKTFLDNPIYDEDTSIIIYSIITNGGSGVNRSYSFPTFMLKFGDLEIETDWDSLITYGGGNSFDYLNFFKDNIDANNLPSGNVAFNLNGLDCNISCEKLENAISFMRNTNGLSLVWEGDIKSTLYPDDNNALKFIKNLLDANAFSPEDMERKNLLSIYGKKINVSLNELSNCYDITNKFEIAKLVKNVELSESAIVHYNNYFGAELHIDDSDLFAKNKAYSFFLEHGSVDQGGIKSIMCCPYNNQEEIDNLIKFGSEKYGLTEDELYTIMSSIDTVRDGGACSYADACNIIYELYDFDEEKFMKDFGYPMLNGNKLNDNQLLLDFYINTNIGTDNSSLILKNSDGSLHLNNEFLNGCVIDITKQKFVEYDNETYDGLDYIKDFLNSNNNVLNNYETITINTSNRYSNLSTYSLDSYNILKEAINNGDSVSMTVYNFDMYQVDSNRSYSINCAHAITPVGLTEEGVLVRSWGDLYYLPYEDVGCYTIFKKSNVEVKP